MITKHNTVQSTALVPNLDVMDTCYLAWRSIRTGVYVRDTRRFELYAVGIRADLRNWVMRSYRISQYTYARVKGNSNKWSRIPGSRYKCCAAEKKSTCRTTKVLQTKHKWTQLDTRRHKWQLERTLANNSDRHYQTTRTDTIEQLGRTFTDTRRHDDTSDTTKQAWRTNRRTAKHQSSAKIKKWSKCTWVDDTTMLRSVEATTLNLITLRGYGVYNYNVVGV